MPHSTHSRQWPDGFLWGSATAAAQIEGAGHEGGKEDSVWDHFARIPGAIANGENLEQAVDHYHRMPRGRPADEGTGAGLLPVLHQLGARAAGDRAANPEGLDFYSRLVDELLEAGILPWLTLYHWDLPQALEEKAAGPTGTPPTGSSTTPTTSTTVLGDRVQHWTTFNEPFCSSLLGYVPGCTPRAARNRGQPSRRCTTSIWPTAWPSTPCGNRGAQNLGITLNLSNSIPRDPADPVDLDAARRFDSLQNRMFLDPILRGSYPEDTLARPRAVRPPGAHPPRRPGSNRRAAGIPGRQPLPR